MKSSSTRLPDDMALLMPMFSHNLVPIKNGKRKERKEWKNRNVPKKDRRIESKKRKKY